MSDLNEPVEVNGSFPRKYSPTLTLNPWKSHRASASNGNSNKVDHTISVQKQCVPDTSTSATDKLFESEAWPEPSVSCDVRSSTTASEGQRNCDEKPKNKKSNRKWEKVEIEFTSSRGARGGVRLSPNSSATHQSSPSHSNSQSNGAHFVSFRGGVSRRGGPTANGPFARGRGGRYSTFSCHRQSPCAPEQDVSEESGNAVVTDGESTAKPASTVTVYASGVPRGGASVRSRRTTQASIAPVDSNRVVRALNPLALGTYLYPSINPNIRPAFQVPAVLSTNVLGPTNAAVIDGNAAALRTAVILPDLPPLQTPLPSPVDNTVVSNGVTSEVVSLEEMLQFIEEVGWSKARVPEQLRSNPLVASALQVYVEVDNLENGSTKKDDVVIVDDTIFFVPRNAHLTKFLKFLSRQDYIRHHVDYYFSDGNINRDNHLLSILHEHKGACPIAKLLEFNRLRWINTTGEELLSVVANSSAVTVLYDETSRNAIGIAPCSPAARKHLGMRLPTQLSVSDASSIRTEHNEVEGGNSAAVPSSIAEPHPVITQHAATPHIAGSQYFPSPHLIPYAGLPNLAHYCVASPSLVGSMSTASVDPNFNAAVADSNVLYYRALLSAAGGLPQTAFHQSQIIQYPAIYYPIFQSAHFLHNHNSFHNVSPSAFIVQPSYQPHNFHDTAESTSTCNSPAE